MTSLKPYLQIPFIGGRVLTSEIGGTQFSPLQEENTCEAPSTQYRVSSINMVCHSACSESEIPDDACEHVCTHIAPESLQDFLTTVNFSTWSLLTSL